MSLPISDKAKPFLAPAKLNLMLKIIGQKPDGYHLLESIFTCIGLYDTVYIQVRQDPSIRLHTDIKDLDTANNLLVRAAHALQKESKTTLGADIWIDKHIPMGAGLGGGSSDAATTLIALNHLWHTQLSRLKLREMGLTLGADVPFFIFGHPAFAQGIGENLKKFTLKNQWYVIISPPAHVSTAKIFSHKDLTRNSSPCIIRSLEEMSGLQNDMQEVVFQEYPDVLDAYTALSQYSDALMTGSGACVFSSFNEEEAARSVFHQVNGRYKAYCVPGLRTHPLLYLE